MSERLRLRLADGGEIEATVEGALPSNLRDLLAVGYAGNQMHLAADTSDDVSGHALATTVLVRLYDEDDVEGHALTLHLPNAQAAQDLQRKLMAAGVAGLIVVGAATTAIVAPNLTGTAAPEAAPAPITRTVEWDQAHAPGNFQVGSDYGQSIVPPVAQGVYPSTGTAVPAPDVAPGLAADIAAGDTSAAATSHAGYPAAPSQALTDYEVHGGYQAAPSQAVTTPTTPDIAPGLAADIANGDAQAPGYGNSAVPDAAKHIFPDGSVAIPGQSSIVAPATTAPGYGESTVPDVAQGVYPATTSASHAGYQAAPSQALTDYEVHGGYQAAPSQAVDSESHAGWVQAPSQAVDIPGQSSIVAPDAAAPGYGESTVPDVAKGVYPATSSASHAGWQQAPSQAVDSESHAGYPAAPSQAVEESHAGWQQAPSQAVDTTGVPPGLAADLATGDAQAPGYGNSAVPTYPGSTAVEQPDMAPGLKADIAAGDADQGSLPTPPNEHIGGR